MIAPQSDTHRKRRVAASNLGDKNRDAELAQRIHQFLVGRNVPELRHVDVAVQGQTAIVSGRVSTYHAKQLATSCCQRVAGVHHVENLLIVDGSTRKCD